ncbi:MAG: hydrogenase maturation nickel metallochaperone HypA [Prolixibacteraceae bacterium]|nr:hydrogenase maturation nickel metallochaperone HypA [Prolixibacteraceae bacterium]
MHEFSVAQNIVGIVTESFMDSGAKKIITVEIDVGSLSGVITDALEFALDSAKQGSPLENAVVKINNIQALAVCSRCHKKFELTDFFSVCAYCSSVSYEIVKGKELKVKSIEVE